MQTLLPSQHAYYSTEYPRQFILIAGGSSVVIFDGLIDQINYYQQQQETEDLKVVLSENCIKTNELYRRKFRSGFGEQDEELQSCGGLFQVLKGEFPQFFDHDDDGEEKQQELGMRKFLVNLWNNPSFREKYFGNRWEVDPYLVIQNAMEFLKCGVAINVDRNLLFYPADKQDYRTYAYSKLTNNYPHCSDQLLEFHFFPNCFQADTWANVVAVSFSLSDYDNSNYLEEYFEYCEEIAQFRTYRVIMIFTHPDTFTEKVKSGIAFEGSTDYNIRKELQHLKEDYSLIINSLISETMKVMKDYENDSFPNRTYEYHVVNTFYDSDMRELLDFLAIGANIERRNFITRNFELPPFVIPKKHNFILNKKLGKFSDIIIQCEI